MKNDENFDFPLEMSKSMENALKSYRNMLSTLPKINITSLSKLSESLQNSVVTSAQNVVKMQSTALESALLSLSDNMSSIAKLSNINPFKNESFLSSYRMALQAYKDSIAIPNLALSQMQDTLSEITKSINTNSVYQISRIIENIDFSKFEIPFELDENEEFDIASDEVKELFSNGEFTDEDIIAEIQSEVNGEENTDNQKSEKTKKAIKWVVKKLIWFFVFVLPFTPIADRIQEDYNEATGIVEFYKKIGLFHLIDGLFGVEQKSALTEEEAKASIDTTENKNISKQKRDDLIDKIGQIRTYLASIPDDENTGNLLAYLSELEKDVRGKKYGLIFEEHREEIDEVLATHTPLLEEEKDLFIDNGGNINFLIEGDNLASLKLLEKTHKGKVDVIYIDPPYNTGKDTEEGGGFIYDDKFVDENDTFIHSKWLSFMKERLIIAKRLLKKDGVIFISIGKEENATLRVLCDEIFGFQNILGQLVRRTKTTSFRGNYFALRLDYVLCYCGGNVFPNKFMDITDKSKYTKIETEGKYKGELYKDDTAFYLSTLETRPNQRYWIECPDGELVIPPGITFPDCNTDGFKANPEKNDGVWRWEVEQYKSKKHLLSFKKTKRSPLINQDGEQASWNVYTKSYYCDKKDDGNIPTELLLDFLNRVGTKEIKDLDLDFSFPKPTTLISYLIKITNKDKDITILDFFAGSGTTGHAVMKLNAEDGGERKFILCTNNENNICRDVTYERIKRVIDKENYEASLKYFKVGYVPIRERMYYEYADELLAGIRELVELENGINFNENSEIAIVLTDEELEEFINDVDSFKNCKKLYMGHDILPDEEQEQALAEQGVEICIIPDYYYRDLQEG